MMMMMKKKIMMKKMNIKQLRVIVMVVRLNTSQYGFERSCDSGSHYHDGHL